MESFRKFFKQLNIRKFRKNTKNTEKNQCTTKKFERRASFTGVTTCPLETVPEEEEAGTLEYQSETDLSNDGKCNPNSVAYKSDCNTRILNGEEIQLFEGLGTNLSSISEEDCQLWKPHDEQFLREQQLTLGREFDTDSGFKSAEEVGCNEFWKLKSIAEDSNSMVDECFVKTFSFTDAPQMTSSARSSMDSESAKRFDVIRLSLGIGPNHQIHHLASNEIFISNDIVDDEKEPISSEMLSMARRTSIDDTDDMNSFADAYKQILPADLDETTKIQRKEILVTLVACGILSIEDAYVIMNNPRRYEIEETMMKECSSVFSNIKSSYVENCLWMPDGFDDCFVDYINFKCMDTTAFKALLESPIPVAVNDAAAFAKVMSPDAKVKDLILDARSSGKYYSFCLNRAVFSGGTQHCPKCHLCVDWRYWHCESCDKCSYGLSFGRCEYCSAIPKNTSNSSQSSSEKTNNFIDTVYTNIEADEESFRMGRQSVDSSVDNLSQLGESKSHGECYCGDACCDNLYCNIIQETCLNGPFLEKNQEMYRSRDTSFVLGNRSSRSRTSESSGKSLTLNCNEDLQYYSTPMLEMSYICKGTNQKNKHSYTDRSTLSKSL